ncbi:MAG: flippase-like domain-containing protein [Chloroflexi bacterium]|nr:flippase-like domain-containing protein [Chloroflexota bacterium]
MSPHKQQPPADSRWRKLWPWISGGLTAVFLIGGVWYLSQTIAFTDIQQALALANGRYILLALAAFTLNGTLKAWRWRVLLSPNNEKRLPFTAVFWAIWLGQFVNTVLPFLRLGEIGRVYAINKQAGLSKMQALSTIVVEKSLELVMLGLLLLVLLPILVLPDYLQNSGQTLLLIAGVAIIGLSVVAYQTAWVIRQLRRLFQFLPQPLERRLTKLLIGGLEGLTSLRSGSAVLRLLGSSVLLLILALLTPYFLFLAFHIPLGMAEAAVIDSALSLTASAPSTPAQLGIFEGTVLLVLYQFGQSNQAINISFAVVYHLIVLLPKIILGGLAANRTKWRWQQGAPS